jgi:hypothetical protein
MDYRLSWNGIPAAYTTVNVTRDEQGRGPLYRVEAIASTGWLVDLLWSLRARVGARFTDRLAPLGFRYDREVNKERSLTDVSFDPPRATGTHYGPRGETRVLAVSAPDLLDPITAIFRALSHAVHVGETLQYDVFTGEARYRVWLTVSGEERVTVHAGTFMAWRMEPEVWKIGSGKDQRLRRATIWVSQGPVRTLLRIRSEVFIGAVTCDLLRFEEQAHL